MEKYVYDKYTLSKAVLVAEYSGYSDADLCKEYTLISMCFAFLDTDEKASHMYEYLDFIESLLVEEIVKRFFRLTGKTDMKMNGCLPDGLPPYSNTGVVIPRR